MAFSNLCSPLGFIRNFRAPGVAGGQSDSICRASARHHLTANRAKLLLIVHHFRCVSGNSRQKDRVFGVVAWPPVTVGPALWFPLALKIASHRIASRRGSLYQVILHDVYIRPFRQLHVESSLRAASIYTQQETKARLN